MEKLTKIKNRILEHRKEVKMLSESKTSNLSARKGIEMQLSHLKKAISQLGIKYVKAGGKIEDLEEKKSIPVNAALPVANKKKTKKGSK